MPDTKIQRGTEIATIDVSLVTVQTNDSEVEIALDTANSIAVTVNSETTDAVKLIIKGKLKAQKGEQVTVTGNNIVLTDNVFNPEMVQILQGGIVEYDDTGAFKSYTPPNAGEDADITPFTLNAYSAIYGADALIKGYEKISYPNCQGQPIALSSEDGAFRAPEYTINSAPDVGQPPYKLEIVAELPSVTDSISQGDQISTDTSGSNTPSGSETEENNTEITDS
jgi:hypothetical protein